MFLISLDTCGLDLAFFKVLWKFAFAFLALLFLDALRFRLKEQSGVTDGWVGERKE